MRARKSLLYHELYIQVQTRHTVKQTARDICVCVALYERRGNRECHERSWSLDEKRDRAVGETS